MALDSFRHSSPTQPHPAVAPHAIHLTSTPLAKRQGAQGLTGTEGIQTRQRGWIDWTEDGSIAGATAWSDIARVCRGAFGV
jgi:hypothetical protein